MRDNRVLLKQVLAGRVSAQELRSSTTAPKVVFIYTPENEATVRVEAMESGSPTVFLLPDNGR